MDAAAQMRGSVKAENLDGGGLCVTLTLPLAKEDSHAENSDR